jgi:hypothetical protein
VQLLVQVVDEAGQITHEALEMVGDVPPGGRGSFRVELPDADVRLVVTVHAFEFGAMPRAAVSRQSSNQQATLPATKKPATWKLHLGVLTTVA